MRSFITPAGRLSLFWILIHYHVYKSKEKNNNDKIIGVYLQPFQKVVVAGFWFVDKLERAGFFGGGPGLACPGSYMIGTLSQSKPNLNLRKMAQILDEGQAFRYNGRLYISVEQR